MSTRMNPRRLLYFSPFGDGGLADYAQAQAEALAKIGVDVVFLTSKRNSLLPGGGCEVRCELGPLQEPWGMRFSAIRKVHYARRMLGEFSALARTVAAEGFDKVLMCSYVEYLAPLWAGQLRRIAQRGVVFASVIHDPVRDYLIGPVWWHRWSVACAYSFLSEAFVHEAIELDTVRPMLQLSTTVLPLGPFRFPPPKRSAAQVRDELVIPPTAKVLLAFGHVRDGKNLDLAIKAMASEPHVYLIVAGKVSSSSQKPIEHYQAVAAEAGVAGRCRWLTEFIPSDEVGVLFEASDAVLLTYNAGYRSASGVLNAAVAYRRPCIASSGLGNLRTTVVKYGLGVFVEPDSSAAIEAGIRQWLGGIPEPKWEAYARENSWEINARIVSDRLWKNGRAP
jgi:glycosyltransferase involved in cell wall biosynthesis